MLSRLLLTTFIFLVACLPCSTCAASLQLANNSWEQTARLYQKNDCLTSEQKAYGREILKGLSYNSQRVFRKICHIRPLSFSQCQETWSLLITTPYTYEQVLCFEKWMDLGVEEWELAIKGLRAIHGLTLDSGPVFQALLTLADITPGRALDFIENLKSLSDSALIALAAMPPVHDMTAAFVAEKIPQVSQLNICQAQAFAALATIKHMNSDRIHGMLTSTAAMPQEICWFAEALFQSPDMHPAEAENWLFNYCMLPLKAREQKYLSLSNQEKKLLLAAMAKGNRYLARALNNLHTVTNRFGQELSYLALMQHGLEDLCSQFLQLPRETVLHYQHPFEQAKKSGSRSSMARLLIEATATARKQLAENLTTARIYMLLTQGDILYDSSYRDILVPILRERIETSFASDVLQAFSQLDPSQQYLSDFITANAQKGTLSDFFPTESSKQKELFEHIMRPALENVANLISFSVNIPSLMEIAGPEARTFLISQLVRCAQLDNASAPYCTIILAYLKSHHIDWLTAKGRTLLLPLGPHLETINLDSFQRTPFSSWKSDNELQALSLFYPDADGRQSFLSFVNLLQQNGYSVQPHTGPGNKDVFSLLQNQATMISYHKQVSKVNIIHRLSVYAGEKSQKELLLHFLKNGGEIIAQRGHSYWREEQLLRPLTTIHEQLAEHAITLPNAERFVTLGSCGGMKVYTDVTQLLNGNVSIMATTGTGQARINNSFMVYFPELVAASTKETGWDDIAKATAHIFPDRKRQIYVQPGSLPAILHKIQFPPQRLAIEKDTDNNRASPETMLLGEPLNGNN
ncbi:hypothetical protein [Desulfogranum japonicum]|uniref:hypothetical protein n=1 Tax=Desulfogranum japonicum TaxID=231447 RepID=UPI00042660EB|nr:hypothetical protein [Desulfogranum japonicum]